MIDSDQYLDEASVTTRLKELARGVSTLIDTAPLEQKIRLLRLLEELHRGDRREYPRKPCSMRVTYTTQDLLGRDSVKDISVGGVHIDTKVPFPIGQQITLMLSPPDVAEEISIPGEVVWGPGQGIGVSFTQPLSKELRATIDSL